MINRQVRQYIFGLIFIGIGCYQFYVSEYLEFGLYVMAGSAFICNALIAEPQLYDYKKKLVGITWTLIIGSSVLFLYLLRYKFM